MAIEIKFDVNALYKRLTKRTDRSQSSLAIQVLKDSNYFCPEDVGTLQKSAVISSNKDNITWNTVYAKKQYYSDDNKSIDKNPNASSKWFERAKSEHEKDWIRLANAQYNK